MTDLNKIRQQYRKPDGTLGVSEDDPRYQTAVMTALDHDLAERGQANKIGGHCQRCGARVHSAIDDLSNPQMIALCANCAPLGANVSAERGQADVAADNRPQAKLYPTPEIGVSYTFEYKPVLTEANRLRDIYARRLAEAKRPRVLECVTALIVGLAIGVALGAWCVKAWIV